ncbi:MAG: cytochrome [Verrucomicrobiales bacterium]|jgi:mono/diheme cytochrome c family protein|nr:cytochrome [Verrucomicrobiales bacterium]
MRFFHFIIGFLALCILVFLVLGKQGDISRKPPIEIFPDMDRQLKLRPQTDANLSPMGLSSRLPVEGTVARGAHYQDNTMNTGKIVGTTNFVEISPVPVSATLLARGQERFQISCSPCHGMQGDGKGITTKYGMGAVANFHDIRIIKMPDGEIFNTITYGKGLMGAYGPNVVTEDRWAIIAYLRALQRSRLALPEEVPANIRASLKK